MEFDFLQTLTLILIGLLFGKDTVLPWIAQKFGFKLNDQLKDARDEVMADNRNAMQPLLSEMEELKLHYNHETTDLLTEIRDELRRGFGEIRTKHSEWDRFGVPTRDCEKNK